MTSPRHAFDLVCAIVTDIAGGPELLGVDLTRDTRFHDDLALESVDLVTLAAELAERTAGVVNLADRLSELELDDLVDLTLGQLADLADQDLAADLTASEAV